METDTQYLADRFTVNPNRHDVHIRCNVCGVSKAGSLAQAWALSHDCRTIALDFIRRLDRFTMDDDPTVYVADVILDHEDGSSEMYMWPAEDPLKSVRRRFRPEDVAFYGVAR